MPTPVEHRLDELVDLQFLGGRLQGLHHDVKPSHRLDRCGAEAGGLRICHRLEQRYPTRLGVGHEPLERGVADTAARPVGDPQQRHRVGRVVENGEVRDGILDLGPLVEPWAADHLIRDLLAHQDVLEHAALRVGPVEDGDLGSRPAVVDETRDLRRDEARLGVLVLDLDDLHRLTLSELREETLGLAVPVVLDHRVGGAENRVRRAVVLLESDRARPGKVALEVEDVADVGATEAVDRIVGDDPVGDEVVRPFDIEVEHRTIEVDPLHSFDDVEVGVFREHHHAGTDRGGRHERKRVPVLRRRLALVNRAGR